ncbi:hypothetical protein LshimejAT787_0407180 [Lyophyllum shimeji]|uniref:Uncharacterized protein n=1 Tax=Lyophyllum shimeji TaxID=47721 RepID=A0A9P3PLU9_LYOSH|nr:hypothetical protein LshimejAT787_0407180 [Lyophyllum shimeji]
MPQIADQDKFKGVKAVVVGACNSGHDIAQDFTKHGIDVTMYQRSSTYVVSAKSIAQLLGGVYHEGANVEYADRVNASFTFTVTKLLHKRITPYLAEGVDKDILDGLKKVGFNTTLAQIMQDSSRCSTLEVEDTISTSAEAKRSSMERSN